MPLESAVILPILDAGPVVEDLRWRYEPQARYGLPTHITLLSPFAHPSAVGEATAALEELFRLVPAFDFSLVEVRRFPAAVYLHPEPAEPFVQLIDRLARRWPEFPPYGGAFSTVIPHVTVAARVADDVLDLVDRNVARHLPIRCRATEAWLMCNDEHGVWKPRAVFPLAG
jgi:hypothetical protein